MKLLTLTAPTYNKSSETHIKSKNYSFICLENQKDIEYYSSINVQIKSRQAVNFWMGFKSQPSNFVRGTMDYAQHEVSNENGMAFVLATQMNLSDKPTSLVQYCSNSDALINDMHKTMFRWVNNGSCVRINESGGYCPITNDFSEYERVVDINEQELFNFLLHKKIKPNFKISSETVVIENENYIPDDLVKQFCEQTKYDKKKVQIITSFKHKTLLFQIVDYKTFFNDGIVKAGLKNIVFETTAQDQKQINGLKQILESIMYKYPEKTLNIYIKVYERHRELFKTEAKNINIFFIN